MTNVVLSSSPTRPRGAKVLFFWDYDTQWGGDRSRTPGGPKDWGKLEFPNTDRLLEIHERFAVPACFAVVGRAALPGDRPYHDPAQVRRIHGAGHEIGSHSLEHDWLPGLSGRALRETLSVSKDALEQCIGEPVGSFVPPYNQPFDHPRRLAFSLSERREVRRHRTDLPALCDALAETGYRFCRVSYRPAHERLLALWTWTGRLADRPGRLERIAGLRCVRLNTPGGFDAPALAMLERCAKEGGLLVVYGHPHSLHSGNAQDEKHLVAFLERFARLRAEGRAEAVLPRDLLRESAPERSPSLSAFPASVESGALSLCAISYKECWQDESGRWFSSGGFPLQMSAIASLFGRVTIVIVRGAPREGALPLPAGARVVALPAPAGRDLGRKASVLGKSPAYLTTLAREIRAADVVHTPLPGDIPFLGFVVAVLLRKRVIARYGSSWDTNGQTTVANRFTRGLLRALAGGRRVVLATGGGSLEPARRVHWIFATALSRAEIEAHRPDLDRGLSDPPRLLTIGRLSSEKGVDVLIRAVADLSRRGLPVRLTLAGDGPERRALEDLARELGVSVRFAGQLAREALGREIASADLCVAPSRTEGFSKAWLDAFVGGLPVLATRVGAAAAAVGEAGERGWLVPSGDTGALADAIAAVIERPPDWPALRRRCREFVAARTLESWAGRIGELCAAQWRMTVSGGKLRAW